MADLKISELLALGPLESVNIDDDLIAIAKNQGVEGNRKYTLREVWDSFKNDDVDPFPQYLTSTEGNSLYQPIGGTAQNVITYTTSRNSISADLGSWLRYDTNLGVTYYLDQEQVPGWPLMEEITIEQVGDGDITIDMASSFSGQIIYDINKSPTTNGPGSVIKIRKVVDSAGASNDRFLIYGDLLSIPTSAPATPIIQCIPMACSDETTNLTTGLKLTFRMPYAMTLTDVRASLTSFNLSAPSIVDIHCNGVSIFTLGNLLTVDPEEYSSVTGTPYVFNDNYLPDNSEIEVYLTDIGAGTPKGLKVYLIGEVG